MYRKILLTMGCFNPLSSILWHRIWLCIFFSVGIILSVACSYYCILKNAFNWYLRVILPVSSGSWMLSGRLARMLLIDCEQNSNDYPLAISGMANMMSCILLWQLTMVFICFWLWWEPGLRAKWKMVFFIEKETITVMPPVILELSSFREPLFPARNQLNNDFPW